MQDSSDGVAAIDAVEDVVENAATPQGSWVRWSPIWREVDGHGEVVVTARYGGPLSSYLTEASKSLISSGRMDPSII